MKHKVYAVSLLLAAAVLLLCFDLAQAMSAFQPDKGIIHIIPTLILPTQPKVTLYPGKPTIPPVDTLAPGKPTDSPR
jgi:hypothetical protein